MQPPLFVQIPTEDGLTLPGLLYIAPGSKKAMINLHGNGSSSVFYNDDQAEECAKGLTDAGISLLMFNNRGAHIIKKLNVKKDNGSIERKRFGMAYEIIKECVFDIDAAIAFLQEKGYEEFYLKGDSTGANKICIYNHYKPENKISKYILVGPGDDVGLYYTDLGAEKFTRLLHEAEEAIHNGHGSDIICELLPMEVFSYKGWYDVTNPNGDYNTFPFLEAMGKVQLSQEPLFRYFKEITKPTLVLFGENDEYQYNDVPKVMSILKTYQNEFTYEIVKDTDHGLSDRQEELASRMSAWVNSKVRNNDSK